MARRGSPGRIRGLDRPQVSDRLSGASCLAARPGARRQRPAAVRVGALSSDGAIAGNDNDGDPRAFEPHYDTIDKNDQVEIYESILGNAESVPTTGLLSAVTYLKDNRLLPRGFDKETADPQIGVFGGAATDDTFAGGGDRVRYRLAIPPERHVRRIDVTLWYQPVGCRWAHNLDGYRSTETERFLSFFRAMAGSTATVVATASRTN